MLCNKFTRRGSRKASSALAATVAMVVVLTSCGIRPLKRPDNNISGVDVTNQKETEPPSSETEEPIIDFDTTPPETYPHEYYPGSAGMGTDYPALSYLTDENYIKDHTVGFYYIKNKGVDLYFASLTVVYSDYLVRFDCDSQILADYKYATVFQMIELDNGYYAFISPHSVSSPYPLPHVNAAMHYALSVDQDRINTGSPTYAHPLIKHLWSQSFIIEPTKSGAYTLTTRTMDMAAGCHLSVKTADILITTERGDETFFHKQAFYSGVYIDDDDYTDEWIFVPAEPPESDAGTGDAP